MGNAADRRLFWTTAGAVVAADLVTKLLAESLLARHLPVQVIGDYVQLRLVYNQCAAFGLCLGAYSRWIFFGLAIAALFVLRSMVRSARPGDRFRIVSLALVCAGAVGNVVDRLRSAQGVVDFVDVGIGSARWPTFNVADSAITVGAIALAVSLWLDGRAQGRAGDGAKGPGGAGPWWRPSLSVSRPPRPGASPASSPISLRCPALPPPASSPPNASPATARRCAPRPGWGAAR